MPTHRIRLIGPWEYSWTGSLTAPTESLSETTSGSVKMPCDWLVLFGTDAGAATFSRRFHCPTNLEPHERVFLVFEGIGGQGEIALNDEVLAQVTPTDQPVEVEVTNRLQRFNRLNVSLQFNPQAATPYRGGLYGAVVLEIRA